MNPADWSLEQLCAELMASTEMARRCAAELIQRITPPETPEHNQASHRS